MKTAGLVSIFLFSAFLHSNGQWSYTNLSEPKSCMGSASLGTKAYFAGGQSATGYLTTVETYDVNTKLWEITGNLSAPRQFITGVVCGSQIFFAGGMDWNVTFSTVDIYDTVNGQWTVEQLSSPRFDFQAVSKGNKVLFAGGVDFPFTMFDVVDIYDVQTGEWSTDTLSQARCGLASAVVGDLAIFTGGMLESVETTDRVDIYNFSTNSWSTDTLSQARAWASASTVGDKVLIAGGLTSLEHPSDRVDIYDASTGTWDTATLFSPRASLGNAATVNGKAYFAGGGNWNYGFYEPSDVVDIYNGTNWSVDGLFESLVDHSVLGVENYLLVAGGANPEGNLISRVEIFNTLLGIIPQPKENLFFRVYPNPGSGKFHLDLLNNTHHNPLLVAIYNLQGQVVFTETLLPYDLELNVDLPAGVYLLNVNSGEHNQKEIITIQN